MIRLPVRRCPDCRYVGPTWRFAAEGDADWRCPRCGREVEPPDPRLQ